MKKYAFLWISIILLCFMNISCIFEGKNNESGLDRSDSLALEKILDTNNLSWCKYCIFRTENSRIKVLSIATGNLSSFNNGRRINIVPDEIGLLTELDTLFLDENYADSYVGQVIPPFQLSDSIYTLKKLKYLTLQQRKLVTLPATIRNLTNLEYFGFFENELSSIPPEIGYLRKLRHLYLGKNKISAISPEIGKLDGLKFLTLGVNKLTELPMEFWNLTNLIRLDISNNHIANIPIEIKNLSKLEYLIIGGNSICTAPPYLENMDSVKRWAPNIKEYSNRSGCQ